MSGALKYFFAVVFVVMVSITAAYVHFFVSTTLVINRSSQPLHKIRVEYAGSLVWTGDLQSGASKRLFTVVEGDGEAVVSYEADGRKIEIRCGYVTGGPMATSAKFVLNPDRDGC